MSEINKLVSEEKDNELVTEKEEENVNELVSEEKHQEENLYLEFICLRNKKINFIKNDNCIGHTFRRETYWELWMLDYFKKYYIPNTNMIDLGGNIGSSSLLMSEVVTPENNIFVFEPIYYKILNKNIIDNNLTKTIHLFPYGVGKEDKEIYIPKIDFNKNDNYGAKSIVGFDNLKENENDLLINIKSLDSFNFENISLIKIDVENMEIDVLQGAIKTITKCKPTIIIESHMYNELINSNIYKLLENLGYEISSIPEGSNDFILKIKDIYI